MFSDFDFSLLGDPSFKEDSVREELITPLLKELGYSASPPNQIQRSVALKHPYVYIGTKKIVIKPDFGLHILKLGLALDRNLKKFSQVFVVLDVDFVCRIDELSYSFASHLEMDGVVYLATFDFSKDLLAGFFSGLEPKDVVPEVRLCLTKYPFK